MLNQVQHDRNLLYKLLITYIWRKYNENQTFGRPRIGKAGSCRDKISGIIIPETSQEKTQQATVEAVGPGTEKEKITVKPGEKILYDKYSGTGIKIDGEDYLILKNSDIIAVIE